jgi:hypothetical protein
MSRYYGRRRTPGHGITPRQYAFIEKLLDEVFDNYAARNKFLIENGVPDDGWHGPAVPKLTQASRGCASLLIEALQRRIGAALSQFDPPDDCPDPGELAADRWAESQVGL